MGENNFEEALEEMGMAGKIVQYVNKKDLIFIFPKLFDQFLIKMKLIDQLDVDYNIIGTLALIVGDADNQSTNFFSKNQEKKKFIVFSENLYQSLIEDEDRKFFLFFFIFLFLLFYFILFYFIFLFLLFYFILFYFNFLC